LLVVKRHKWPLIKRLKSFSELQNYEGSAYNQITKSQNSNRMLLLNIDSNNSQSANNTKE
ncbi:3278_t:CDS:1, partial [Scutellospora calospora]